MGVAEPAGGAASATTGTSGCSFLSWATPQGQEEERVRIAASADLHFTPQSYAKLKDQFERVREEADVLVLAGDLTNYGQPEEMDPLLNVLVRLRLPTIVVLGNHDYESGREEELKRMMIGGGVKVLDGSGYERDGVGFAGAKGFVGGFGRGVLTAFGEREIKEFVRAAIDETLKLERGIAQLRAPKRVIVVHYSPIAETVQGEAPEIFPFLGTSRMAEVIDRHGADLVLHGHAHHGKPDGQTRGGVPVHNVAISLLQAQTPSRVYRVFDL